MLCSISVAVVTIVVVWIDFVILNSSSLPPPQCAVMVAAICPFSARINHSCDPNAELKSQEYVDGHVDVVARRDISVGEEVTIAYIDSTSRRMSSRFRRQRELRSRDRCECVCERCSDDTTTGE